MKEQKGTPFRKRLPYWLDGDELSSSARPRSAAELYGTSVHAFLGQECCDVDLEEFAVRRQFHDPGFYK